MILLRSLSALLVTTVLSATLLAQDLHANQAANAMTNPAQLHAHEDADMANCQQHKKKTPARLLQLRPLCPCGCSDASTPATPIAPLGQALLAKRSPAWIIPPAARLFDYPPALIPLNPTRIDHVPKSA
jgi:hypothetical protein